MGIGIEVFKLIINIRLKRIFFFSSLIIVCAIILLDCFDFVNGKTRKIRKRKRNRGTPVMIVFNLDETLWPFKVDKVMTPPLNVTSKRNQVVDRVGRVFNLFQDVAKIFEDLEKKYFMLGVISQSTDVEKVENLLELFDIDQYLNIHEIFPGNKRKHLERISERSRVHFEDILYFDADPTYMNDIASLDVTTVLVDKNGISVQTVYEGLHTFNVTQVERNRKEKNNASTTFKP